MTKPKRPVCARDGLGLHSRAHHICLAKASGEFRRERRHGSSSPPQSQIFTPLQPGLPARHTHNSRPHLIEIIPQQRRKTETRAPQYPGSNKGATCFFLNCSAAISPCCAALQPAAVRPARGGPPSRCRRGHRPRLQVSVPEKGAAERFTCSPVSRPEAGRDPAGAGRLRTFPPGARSG